MCSTCSAPMSAAVTLAGERYVWDAYSMTSAMKAPRVRATCDVAAVVASGSAAAPLFRWNAYGAAVVLCGPGAVSADTAAERTRMDWHAKVQASGACEPYGCVRRALAADDAPASAHDACEVLHIGQVPYAMHPDTLRWVLQRLTGVTALKIEQRRNRSTRGRTGLFTAVVRAEDADAVVAAHHRALCCAEFLWVPACDAAEAEELCARLRTDDGGLVKNGLLSVARRRPQRDAVPQELHVVESERRRPLVWQTLSVRHLSVVPVRALRRDDSLTYQMIQ